MAGRPSRPIDFIGEDQIAVFVDRLQSAWTLYMAEFTPHKWMMMPDRDTKRLMDLKKNAKFTLDLVKGSMPLLEVLCKQYDNHDDAADAAKQLAQQIAMYEGKARGQKG